MTTPLSQEVEQREQAPFPLVVGAHDEEHVFEAHHQHQRPEHQRQHAEDVRLVGGERVVAVKAGLYGVERACADVAEDDAQRTKRQGRRQPFMGVVGVVADHAQGVGLYGIESADAEFLKESAHHGVSSLGVCADGLYGIRVVFRRHDD